MDCIADLELADEVVAWSDITGSVIKERERAIHVTGYPLAHRIEPARRPRRKGARVLVLVQGAEHLTARMPARTASVHCATALTAVVRVLPDARVTLRPHPSHSIAGIEAARARFPDFAVDIDRSTPIVDLIRHHDICVGAQSTAVFEAALTGIPVVVLNVTSFEWNWPLGGDTPVPVARNSDQLSAILAKLTMTNGGEPPGRQELLAVLGATGHDGSARLVELLNVVEDS
jgi:hypothetical protein